MERKQLWQKPDGTRITVPIEEEIRSVLVREKKAGNKLMVCIGTDSGMGFAFRAKPHAFASSSRK